MTLKRQVQPAGFTLVELLVVIAIIGILVGLLIPAVYAVKKTVINGKIAIDLSQVAQAMDTYKIDHEAYPPNSADIAELQRFIQRTWPKIDNTELASISTLLNTYLDPAEAIPFWLGGFSTDAKFPFTGPGGPLIFDGSEYFANPERNKGTSELDVKRLTLGQRQSTALPGVYGQRSTEEAPAAGDSFPVYIGYGSDLPLVYFHHTSYGNPLVQYPPVPTPETGVAKPYLSNRTDPNSPFNYEWLNEDTFQLISAGQDNNYGNAVPPYPIYPDGTNYAPAPDGGDDDNVTNFSEGKTLGDKKP